MKNAFLNDILQEPVYISQPPGFKNLPHAHHFWKQKKTLYGLKQAPRAWLDTFNSFLFDQGFLSSNADPSSFVLKRGKDIIILLLYVDDMIITRNSTTILADFLQKLKEEFVMKDLGQVHYFLGIQIQTTASGL